MSRSLHHPAVTSPDMWGWIIHVCWEEAAVERWYRWIIYNNNNINNNKRESEGITQSDLRTALSINLDLPRRRAELKWKHASADDTLTQACYPARPTCCSSACSVHHNPRAQPTAGHDLHPSRATRWRINARARAEKRDWNPRVQCNVIKPHLADSARNFNKE